MSEKPLRIWIIKTGEPLPPCRPKDRWMRAGNLARTLAERGHEVIWWTGTFDHFTKSQFYEENTTLEVLERLTLCLMHSPGYTKHLSFKRLRDHQVAARQFVRLCQEMPRPDLVFCCLPTLDLSCAAANYCRKRNVPLIVDIRDWWPDLFLFSIPKCYRPLAKPFFALFEYQARYACSRATAITGTTEGYVRWGLRKAGRIAKEWDRPFYLASTDPVPTPEEVSAQEAFWRSQGIMWNGNDEGIICYIGSLGFSFDLTKVIDAARLLTERQRRVKFVLCGKGDRETFYRHYADGLENVVLPGWMNSAQLYTLLQHSFAGIAPLPDRDDFLCNINNKPIQYLSAGLPVVSTPPAGALYDLLQAHQCGESYRNGDAQQLAALIERLIDNPDQQQQMAVNARRVYHELFDPTIVYKEMADYVETVAVAYQTSP